jgi:ribosomal protein S18 acetylase RimI-like enzyme
MEIREATEGDFEAIVRLAPSQGELFLVYPKGKHPFTVGQLRNLAEVRTELTVAIRDGEVIGFANLYDVKLHQWAFIGNVVVSRTFRGGGVGQKLVSHMVRVAFEKHSVPEVRISVFSENTPALLLYASLHFKPYSIEAREDPSGRRVALVHMKLSRMNSKPNHSVNADAQLRCAPLGAGYAGR